MISIGIIGNGFVGNAMHQGLRGHYNVLVYDTDPEKSPNSIRELDEAKYVFLCVPASTTIEGKLDLSIVKSAISDLAGEKIIIIKSTLTPSASEEIVKPLLRILRIHLV